MKRVRIKKTKPNPLFELWLEEWKEEAASRNSDLRYHFSKALASLRKYPLPLKSGRDCVILQHFGKKLCLMLDRKLEKYKTENNGLTNVDNICFNCKSGKYVAPKRSESQNVLDNDPLNQRTELALFDKLNLSAWNLGDYAALLALYKETHDPYYLGFIIESDLISEMKSLCSYASKDSIGNLFDYGLLSKREDPIRYNLTEDGIKIAKKLCDISTINVTLIKSSEALNQIQKSLKSYCNGKTINIQTSNECSVDTQEEPKSSIFYKCKSAEFPTSRKRKEQSVEQLRQQTSKEKDTGRVHDKAKRIKNVNNCELNEVRDNRTNSASSLESNIRLESNTFDIILLVDTQETSGVKTKPQHDATIAELTELGVLFEIRHLKVGDFAWIARCRITNSELILPYIVERKRIDDLSGSITDGRFHEQKFRLKQSGITNLIYIIEEYQKGQRLAIPYPSLMQASINTLIQDGFSVKYTKSHKDSMFYLSSLTRILIKVFKEKNLIGCKKENAARVDHSSDHCSLMEFGEFNKAASKQKVFKVSQMFIRQLLQLKGMSVDKALAIVERYPTPRTLVDAYQLSDCNAELLLANTEVGDKKRVIGSQISKTIYQLYSRKNLN